MDVRTREKRNEGQSQQDRVHVCEQKGDQWNSQATRSRGAMYGLEMLAIGRGQEAELEVAELKMLRFSLGVTICNL